MKLKITLRVLVFISIAAVLAWFLYSMDLNEAREKLALQGTQLVGDDCTYFDGFRSCEVDSQYCTSDGNHKPLSLGFCGKLGEPRFNRAAIGDACDADADCDLDEYCVDTVCVACTRDSHCSGTENLCYNNICVECESDTECIGDELCTSNACVGTEEEVEAATGGCETRGDCGDNEYCYENNCVDADDPQSWSTAEFNNTLTGEFRNDWDTITEDINISKKWLWYSIFALGVLVALGLLFPGKNKE